MEVILRSTTKVVDLVVNGAVIRARVWEGTTARGVRCHAFITRVAVKDNDDCTEFDRDLQEQDVPSADVAAIPLRLIL